jgi:protein-S-isoprenylcysteine O-methyltransferase Ste14
MSASHQRLAARSGRRLLAFIALQAAIIFLPAGTLDYWQGWVYLGIFVACCALVTAALLKLDPALVARRLEVGPKAEREPAQKRIQWFASLGLLALYIVSALDHGQGWSIVPTSVVLIGDLLTALGFALLLFLGTPLALGSWWGLAVYIPSIAALVARLRDEEQFLMRNLPGYDDYFGFAWCRESGEKIGGEEDGPLRLRYSPPPLMMDRLKSLE